MKKNLLSIAILGMSSLYAGYFNPPTSVEEAQKKHVGGDYFNPPATIGDAEHSYKLSVKELLDKALKFVKANNFLEAKRNLSSAYIKPEASASVKKFINMAVEFINDAQNSNVADRNTNILAAQRAITGAINAL